MVNMNMPRHCRQQGVSLIEVLIAMVILAIGLLGLVGLQGRLHVTQVESYQRAQALILLQDMANRIALNRNDALGYVTADPIGTDMPGGCPVVNVTRTERDIGEWCQFLIGASETLGGESVGAMVGGRGCIEEVTPGSNEFLVTVAWQGMAPTVAPPNSVTCGEGLYDGPEDTPCVNDLCRRIVTTVVRLGPRAMMNRTTSRMNRNAGARWQRGFSLVELMVSIVIGLIILAAMVALFVNSSGANRELARANTLIENGRLAIELLESDVAHAGYWGSYMPEFDDQTFGGTELPLDPPTDVPTAVPDPCLPYDTPWSAADQLNFLHVPVNVYDSDATCAGIVLDKADDTDVLVVRHAELCEAGSGGNCEDDIDGNVYFQSSRCEGEDPFRFGTVDDPGSFSTCCNLTASRRLKSASSSPTSITSVITR